MSAPTVINSISITGGAWSGSTYNRITTNQANTYIEYGLSIAGAAVANNYYIGYNWTTRKWYDTQPTNHHNTFGTSNTDLYTTSRETTENPTVVYIFDTSPRYVATFTNPYHTSGPTVTYGPTHGALPLSTGFTVRDLNFSKMGDREYRISYKQQNAPSSSYTVRVSHDNQHGTPINTDFTVTTAAVGNTINLESGSLYGTGPQAASSTPKNNGTISIRFMDFDAKLGTLGSTIGQGLIFQSWTYLYNNIIASFTPSTGVPGTVFNFTLTGSDDSYASTNTATLTDPSGTVTTFTKNAYGQFLSSVTNVTSIEGSYTVEHPAGVNRGTSTYDNSGPPIVETSSNGGGKPDRYPLIMTNLFNRNRSIYSIGMTHKDTWDLFL